MKPIFSTQITARVALWAFVFMAELLIRYSIKTWQDSYGHFAIYITTAILVFIATFRLGPSDLVVDFRDLCFYDVIVHCIDWYSHESGYSLHLFLALNYTVVVLKFARLLWPVKTDNGKALAYWPTFGPFTFLRNRKSEKASSVFSVQSGTVYVLIVATFALNYLVRSMGAKTPLELWALIGVILFLMYFQPFLTYLEKREAQEIQNEKAAAVLTVTTEKNAELERKNAELAQLNALLATQHAQLEQAYREKDDALQLVEKVFKTLATAAHDLRAPLTTITVRADALMRANESERANAKLMLHSAVRYVCDGLDHAIHQAKLTNKLALPKVRAIFLPDVLRTLHTDWCDFAFEKHLAAFQVYPKRGCKVIVASDTWVLQRILRNLVVNAIEHSKPGNGIGMSIRQKEGRCLVRVWNTGDAIADACGPDREANFARLVAKVRASGYRSSAAGHGLGLESVAQLAEVLGVKMGLQSRPKRGTVFGFALELASAELIAETQRLAEQEYAEMAEILGHSDRPLIIR